MPQGHIVKVVKHIRGHLGSKADFSSPVAGGGLRVGDKGVGDHNVLLIRREPVTHMVCHHTVGIRQAANRLPFFRVKAPDLFLRDPGQKEHFRIVKADDLRLPLRRAGDIESRFFQQLSAAGQPLRAVVVSGDGKNPRIQFPANPVHGVIVKPDCRPGGNGTVIHIAGQQHGIHLPLPNNPANFIDKKALVFQKIVFAFRGSQVPIRGM